MSAYLDASAIVPLFVDDDFSTRIDVFLRGVSEVHVSDFAAAEFASALGVRIRTGQLTETEARAAFADFDSWKVGAANLVDTLPQDVRAAEAILRRLDLGLRTPDALHISIARRLAVELVTFDKKMAACSGILGVPLAAV